MKIIGNNKIIGVYEILLEPSIDERGFFMRVYDKDIFSENGLDRNWVQENHSKSVKKGVIRGLHLQMPPYSETKFIRCIRGKVEDVFVDLRKGSETFGQWDSVELSEEKFNAVYIPRGFAHGFCTLEENCEVIYKVDNWYSPQSEVGIIWNDTELNINWNTDNPILSEKDKKNLTLKEFINKFGGVEI